MPSLPADFEEKNKFRLGAALSFQAQLQPRSLLIAGGHCSSNARNEVPGGKQQVLCSLPAEPSQP